MAPQTGSLLRGVDADQTVRVIGVDVTDAAEELRRAHDLEGAAAVLGAECLAAVTLLSAQIKGEERLTLQLETENPTVHAWTEVDAEGAVRGRVRPPRIPRSAPLSGVLIAIKADARQELYRGHTVIEDEGLEAALAHHLAQSAQVECALRIGVETREDGSVRWAGGIYVERLPEDPNRPWIDVATFRERVAPLAARDPQELVLELRAGLLGAQRLRILEERPVVWQCRCSLEKVEGMLASLDLTLLRQMRDEDHGAEVTCHFCGQTWSVPEARLEAIVRSLETQFDA